MKIEFVLLKRMPLFFRLILFVLIEFTGLFCQYNIPAGPLLGTAIIIFGAVIISAKNYTNKPSDIGLEDWKPVSENEFTRIKTNLQLTKEIKFPFYFKMGCGGSLLIFFFFSIFIVFVFEAFRMFLLVLDIMIILFPPFMTGIVKIWTPYDLKLKMDRFTVIMDKTKEDKDIVITPYLRLDKDKKGREIPEDIRIMIEPRRKPDDFVGIQFQVAINNGPNGSVPYMYAVYLCKGKGKSFNTLNNTYFGPYIKEAGGDEEYGTIVVRQETSGGGYHTSNSNCVSLYEIVKSKLSDMSIKLKQ